MKSSAMALTALLLVAGASTQAAAQDDPCCPICVGHTTKWVTRTVEVPAVMRTVRKPVFEWVEVPVYGTRSTPVYRTVRKAKWKTREVPVYRTKRTPRYVEVEVPVYATRSVPIVREVCDPRTGETRLAQCGSRTQRYQCGTRKERRIDGWETERIQCGTRCERYQDGCDVRRVRCGTKVERVQVGTSQVRRFKEWQCEQVVVTPARTVCVRECVRVRCRC